MAGGLGGGVVAVVYAGTVPCQCKKASTEQWYREIFFLNLQFLILLWD